MCVIYALVMEYKLKNRAKMSTPEIWIEISQFSMKPLRMGEKHANVPSLSLHDNLIKEEKQRKREKMLNTIPLGLGG
jgi:hypothetical protein